MTMCCSYMAMVLCDKWDVERDDHYCDQSVGCIITNFHTKYGQQTLPRGRGGGGGDIHVLHAVVFRRLTTRFWEDGVCDQIPGHTSWTRQVWRWGRRQLFVSVSLIFRSINPANKGIVKQDKNKATIGPKLYWGRSGESSFAILRDSVVNFCSMFKFPNVYI